MRVIAGYLSGRIFESPRGHRTHPMADKIRGGLFNALGDIKGLSMLDAYSGSGAIAIEAVSRGIGSVVSVELDKPAATVIHQNIQSLGISDKITVYNSTVAGWSRRNQLKKYDIVAIDPPYDKLHMASLVKTFSHVKPDGIVALSWPKSEEVLDMQGFTIIKHKSYGDARLVFYKLA